MTIALFSDIHGNIHSLEKALKLSQGKNAQIIYEYAMHFSNKLDLNINCRQAGSKFN